MISMKVRGIAELQKKLKDIPYGAKKIVLPAISEYLLGNDARGLRHYPPKQDQKYVRTNTLKNGWGISGGVYRERLTNPVPYAGIVPEVWGAGGWKNYGWRMWSDVIKSNMAGAIRHAEAELKKWLASKK